MIISSNRQILPQHSLVYILVEHTLAYLSLLSTAIQLHDSTSKTKC